MKQAVSTIRRKGLDQFDGKSRGSKGWFKIDSGFLKTTFSTIHTEFYKDFLERILNIKTHMCIQHLLYHFMKNLSRKNMKKRLNIISQSEAPAPEEIEVFKNQRDTYYYAYYLYSATVETSLT